MTTNVIRAAAVAGGLVALLAGCARAQGAEGAQGGDIETRVARVSDGDVVMHFSSRPGVCGSVNGDNVSIDDGRGVGRTRVRRDGDREWECVEGPTHVRLRKRDGRVTDVDTRVARGWTASARTTDLGRVPARAAADYLLGLAEGSRDGGAKEAIFPATIADSVESWPRLLRIARNDATHTETRRQAVFWLSQQAGDEVTRGIADLVDDDDEDREVREHAVFALSQRPRDESVPALIRIARTHRDPHIRKQALFWLGQSGDSRALALFEEILSS